MIGHITYLSGDGMGKKFGRELRSGTFERGLDTPVEFEVESLRDENEKPVENLEKTKGTFICPVKVRRNDRIYKIVET